MISEVQGNEIDSNYPSYIIGNEPNKGFEMFRLKLVNEKSTEVFI